MLLVLAVMCTITLAPHVRLYVDQERRQADLRVGIAAQQAAVRYLEQQQTLWADDTYVASQARDRLHYIFPGETAYLVPPALLGDDPADPAITGSGDGLALPPGATTDRPWYRTMWAGMTATAPAPG